MAGKIFINYRRDDSIGMAGRLHDRLAQTFGRDKLFMDVDHIPAGTDFVAHLNSQVAECDVVLVVIGPNWLVAKDESGGRRLDNPDDFVAIEIAAALARDIRVIPVLVDGARMPKAGELPDSLKPLARREPFEVRDSHFGQDTDTLVARIRSPLLGAAAKPRFSNVRERILRGVDILANAVKVTLGPRGRNVNKQLSVAEMEGFIAALYRDRRAARDVLTAHETTEPTHDTVECSVFGPPTVPPNEAALIQLFLHLPEQAKRASFLAGSMDSSATLKGTRSLEIEIKRGARVEVSLAVNGLLIDEPVQSVVWRGQPVFCQFLITTPAGTSGHSFFPVVRVSIDGSLVGCIRFRISSDSFAANPQSRPLGDHARRYGNAFVSYATKDRKEVLKRVQMLNVLKTKFFQDVLSLDPGDRWEQKLYETIRNCDLFLLFWSQAAKDSEWVIKEAEYALKQQQQNQGHEPDIVPVILEQNVLPPQSLATLHFNDRIQYLISLMP